MEMWSENFHTLLNLGPCAVVQSWISSNPGLKLNLLFWFVRFCMSDYFKTLENKTSVDSDKISRKTFPSLTENKLLGRLL
jgi:hypothetical protein